MRYQLIPKFAEVSGYSEKAIRRKIEEGVWLENRQFRRAPDGRIMIDVEAVAALDAPTPAQSGGVYILFNGEDVAYVGLSTNVAARLLQHERSGRQFDRAEVIPCDEATAVWLERELIRTLRPGQNLVRYERHAKDKAWDLARTGE